MDNIVNLYMESVADIDSNSSRHRDIEIPEVDEMEIYGSYMALEEGRVMLEMYQRREIMYAESVGGIFVALLAFIKKAILIILKMVLGIKGLLLLVIVGLIMYFRKKKGDRVSFGGGGGGSSSPSTRQITTAGRIVRDVSAKVLQGSKYNNLSEPIVLVDSSDYDNAVKEYNKIMGTQTGAGYPLFVFNTAISAQKLLLINTAIQSHVNNYIRNQSVMTGFTDKSLDNNMKEIYNELKDDFPNEVSAVREMNVDFGNRGSVSELQKSLNGMIASVYGKAEYPKDIFMYGDLSKILNLKTKSYSSLKDAFTVENIVFDQDAEDFNTILTVTNKDLESQLELFMVVDKIAKHVAINDNGVEVIKSKIKNIQDFEKKIQTSMEKIENDKIIEDKGTIAELNKWTTLAIAMSSSTLNAVRIANVAKNIVTNPILISLKNEVIAIINDKIKTIDPNANPIRYIREDKNKAALEEAFAEYLK